MARMKHEGLSDREARARLFMVDRFGLLTDKMPSLLPFQSLLAQELSALAAWKTDAAEISLLETVQNAQPTVLIGASGQPGLFTEEVIRSKRPAKDRS